MEGTKSRTGLKALILVGGFGTRLRPLTLTKAKPLIEFANKPILCYQIEALVSVGVDEIILAIGYQAEKIEKFLKVYEKKYKVKIACAAEPEPLGTGGPIAFSKDLLLNGGKYFFVFNADVICKYPLQEMLDFTEYKNAEGVIAVTEVSDPSRFGVVQYTNDSQYGGLISGFFEKPKDNSYGNRINAGLYVFSTDILKRLKAVPTSIEREIFPRMANDKTLYAYDMDGFWKDVGTPEEYLLGTSLYLKSLVQSNNTLIAKGANIISPVMIGENCTISEDAIIGPNVVIGDNVTIKAGARIKETVILEGCTIDIATYIEGAIIGWYSKIGKWCRIQGQCIFGEDVKVGDEVLLLDTIILSNVTTKNSNIEKKKVIMF